MRQSLGQRNAKRSSAKIYCYSPQRHGAHREVVFPLSSPGLHAPPALLNLAVLFIWGLPHQDGMTDQIIKVNSRPTAKKNSYPSVSSVPLWSIYGSGI
jgi:hypothetical protein